MLATAKAVASIIIILFLGPARAFVAHGAHLRASHRAPRSCGDLSPRALTRALNLAAMADTPSKTSRVVIGIEALARCEPVMHLSVCVCVCERVREQSRNCKISSAWQWVHTNQTMQLVQLAANEPRISWRAGLFVRILVRLGWGVYACTRACLHRCVHVPVCVGELGGMVGGRVGAFVHILRAYARRSVCKTCRIPTKRSKAFGSLLCIFCSWERERE